MILYNPDWTTTNPWPNLFTEVKLTSVEQLSKGGCLILWGGEDIWPGYYNQRNSAYCYTYQPTARDIKERQYIKKAIELQIPIIGICRGAQMLCIMAGGTLAQHIEGHEKSHDVLLSDEGNEELRCNSSHHQMMIPPPNAKVLAYALETTGYNQFNEYEKHQVVPEVVWFPTINALGIQPHPEWSNSPWNFNEYLIRKIKEYIHAMEC